MTEHEKLDLILQEMIGMKQSLEGRMTGMEGRMTGLEQNLEARMTGLEQNLEGRMNGLQQQMTNLNARVIGIDGALTEVQLTLENETNENILVIADGHRDLLRKLDDALRVNNEKEIMLIRMNGLENELKILKQKIAEIA